MESEPNSPEPAETVPEETGPKVVRKSRGQILADYKLSLATFENILGHGFLKGGVVKERGKNFYEIGAHNHFVFRSAANDIASFKMVKTDIPVLPFHRFLSLRFVNTSPGETYEEAVSIGLLPKNGQYKKSVLSRYYSQFLRNVPLEIRNSIILKQEPVPKEGRRLFRLFLKVLGILVYYDTPELIDDLGYLLGYRDFIEPLMTALGSAEEVSSALGKMVNPTAALPLMPSHAVNAYRNLYYSSHEIGSTDLASYFKTLPEIDRAIREVALNRSIGEFSAREGLSCEHKRVLELLRSEAQAEFLKQTQLRTGTSIQAARSNLDTILKVSDRLDKLGEGSLDIAKIFDRFLVIGAGSENGPIIPASNVIGLHEVKALPLEQKKPEGK